MKRTLLMAALTLVVATAASAASLTQTIDKTFDVKPGASVKLTNVNGRITITAWDQPRVKVVAVKKVEADRDDVQQAMKELRVDLQPQQRRPDHHDELPEARRRRRLALRLAHRRRRAGSGHVTS